MKVLIVIGALAALLAPAHADLRQCAGIANYEAGSGPSNYEPSGSLTAAWTQKACAAVGGSIDPKLKGNQKCCTIASSRKDDFGKACTAEKDAKYKPISWVC
ncbi:hypothetical protein PHMEG_00025500 [Phytophthora megakarya]|uniref:Uncharacterized protein n=1 Tax=Phytophthora megakarya TaxID=4795 RepID=A0A225VDJ2_9STRA|nr:hypothetical protein PHMEG_00025500 [Phytophthora megakarya]